jgi:aminopeptidase N
MSDQGTVGDLVTDELFHVRARVRLPDGAALAASGVEGDPRVVGSTTERLVTAGFVRDFALVASARLRSRTRRAGDVTVRSWFVEGNEASGERVLDAAAQSVTIFSRRFGAYPYTELDLAEAPLVGGAGGVEFSGFATIATMLYRPMDASSLGPLAQLAGTNGPDLDERRRAMLEVVTAHEVAHQWWHGLVGSDSRRHPFQDECLAQWSALLYLEERYGRERARREGEQQVAASYHMMRLLGRPDAAVDQPASAFADSVSYGGIVYGKGPYLYPALRAELGDRAFFAALRDYVSAHRFRMAPPRALYERMARGSHTDAVNALVRRWLEEAHGDDDLGQPDLGRMMGMGNAAPNDPAMQLLQQLLGQMGSGGEEEALRRMMQLLEQGAP